MDYERKRYRECETGKVMFDKKGAITASNARWKEDRVKLRIYPCPECRHWHMTKQVREREQLNVRGKRGKQIRKWHYRNY